jgi:transposase
MMEQVDESGELVERVAALDIGKASVMACIRIPHEDGRGRNQEVREYGATTGALLTLAGHLHRHGVTLVVMEATSVIFCSNKISSSFRRSGLSRTRLWR